MSDDAPDHDGLIAAISTVVDPEAGMNLVDLGLVYDVALDGDRAPLGPRQASTAVADLDAAFLA